MLLDLDTDLDLSLLEFPAEEPSCDYCGRNPTWRAEKICTCNVTVLICDGCKDVMHRIEAKAVLNDMQMSCTACGFVAPTTRLSELIVFHPLTS